MGFCLNRSISLLKISHFITTIYYFILLALRDLEKITVNNSTQYYYSTIFGSTTHCGITKESDVDIILLVPWFFRSKKINLYKRVPSPSVRIFLRFLQSKFFSIKYLSIPVDFQYLKNSYSIFTNSKILVNNFEIFTNYLKLKLKRKINSLRTLKTISFKVANNFLFKKLLNHLKFYFIKNSFYKNYAGLLGNISILIIIFKVIRYLSDLTWTKTVSVICKYFLIKILKEFVINYRGEYWKKCKDFLKFELFRSSISLDIFSVARRYYNTSRNFKYYNIKHMIHLVKKLHFFLYFEARAGFVSKYNFLKPSVFFIEIQYANSDNVLEKGMIDYIKKSLKFILKSITKLSSPKIIIFNFPKKNENYSCLRSSFLIRTTKISLITKFKQFNINGIIRYYKIKVTNMK
ncbi:RNA polymerase subunit F (nucleomorph) [Bigelowiella natans]|uniref:RNA polymerase subunit F n=1 Tax=Bigelowiella natans TaxID=227086 RepID=Q3LWM0_BIGNA|nr:RNA polymerase subunit F [Bigelowiella natans]ABA27146.1 RNA polymerase subunit F [Bigelowiella natans]|mmetsp:Transcript_4392/g.6998  ORF Transcript_4392/g.6998 Transcript_4392/m.6998 type:complete len:405 (-) Transcript_4392:2019-3233(-)